MNVNTVAFEKKARQIIRKHFGVSEETIKKSVYLTKKDPGNWAPNSILVVNHENGLPLFYNTYETWQNIDLELSDQVLHTSVFFESINNAVSALYFA